MWWKYHRKELNIERHIYEKNIMILEGRGVCEVWHNEKYKQVFEWRAVRCSRSR